MTERIRDRIIVNGEDLALLGYLALPEQHPRITLCLPKGDSFDDSADYFATCMEGHWSTWEIENGRLWLVDIRGSLRLVDNEPLLATWINGTIQASLINDVHPHNGFGYRYEETLLLTIKKGRVHNSGLDVTVKNQGWALDSDAWFKLYFYGYETRLPTIDGI